MSKKISKIIITIIFIFIVSRNIFAQEAEKSTIVIYVNNYAENDYLLDLMGKEGEYKYFTEEEQFNEIYPSEYKNKKIYRYKDNSWKAINIRTYLLKGFLIGEYDEQSNMMVHEFSYRVPNKFKIIIENKDGEIFVTDEIKINGDNTKIELDLSTKEIKVIRDNILSVVNGRTKNLNTFFSILEFVILFFIVPIMIEVGVSIVFKIGPTSSIIYTSGAILGLCYMYFFDVMTTTSYHLLRFPMIVAISIVMKIYIYTKKLTNRYSLIDIKTKTIVMFTIISNILGWTIIFLSEIVEEALTLI